MLAGVPRKPCPARAWAPRRGGRAHTAPPRRLHGPIEFPTASVRSGYADHTVREGTTRRTKDDARTAIPESAVASCSFKNRLVWACALYRLVRRDTRAQHESEARFRATTRLLARAKSRKQNREISSSCRKTTVSVPRRRPSPRVAARARASRVDRLPSRTRVPRRHQHTRVPCHLDARSMWPSLLAVETKSASFSRCYT
jgi:hypothetical protein